MQKEIQEKQRQHMLAELQRRKDDEERKKYVEKEQKSRKQMELQEERC